MSDKVFLLRNNPKERVYTLASVDRASNCSLYTHSVDPLITSDILAGVTYSFIILDNNNTIISTAYTKNGFNLATATYTPQGIPEQSHNEAMSLARRQIKALAIERLNFIESYYKYRCALDEAGRSDQHSLL